MTGTAQERTAASLARIAEVDIGDRGLASVCTVHPEAGRLARAADASEGCGPLHGWPVLVKDNIDTHDLPTTAGSTALAGIAHPSCDAPVVTRLREAGAVLLGKTNLSEWANFRDARSTSGWSAYGGQTRNPYGLNRSPCGSSSGSAAAVAAGIARFALGSETDGSITVPAAFCGVVGLKPTVGLLPSEGVVPIAHSQDTVGPMTRTVADTALLMDVLTDTAAYTEALEQPLPGLRVGVVRGEFWGHHQGADEVSERAIRTLAGAGATIVDDLTLSTDGDYLGGDEITVLLSEFAHDLPRYLTTRPGAPQTLEELIAWNEADPDELRWFGQSLFHQALEAPRYGSEEYQQARQGCLTLSRDHGIDRLLREHELDLLLTPSALPATPLDLVDGDRDVASCSSLAAMAGYPLLTVPSGLVHGLPVAITLWGTAYAEPVLLRVGHAFEQLRGPLPAPTFPVLV